MPLVDGSSRSGLGTALLLAAIVGSGIISERLAGGNVAIALLAHSIAMRDRALSFAAAAGLSNVEVHSADATALPLPDSSIGFQDVGVIKFWLWILLSQPKPRLNNLTANA